MYKPFRATISCAGRTYRWHPGWGKTAGFVKSAHITTVNLVVAHVTRKQNKTKNEVKKDKTALCTVGSTLLGVCEELYRFKENRLATIRIYTYRNLHAMNSLLKCRCVQTSFRDGDPFLESPDNFSGPKSCFMFAVFAFKIKVSIILKTIEWNYQLANKIDQFVSLEPC